jgi:chitinase
MCRTPGTSSISRSASRPSATSGDIRFTLCPASECPGVETEAQFISAIRAKQAQGKKILLSIGGQNGQVQLTTTAARDTFVSSVSAIIDRHGLNGLDVDFEGHSLTLNAGDNAPRSPTTRHDRHSRRRLPGRGHRRHVPALREDQIAFGTPAAVSAGNGYTSPAVVQAALNCLVRNISCNGYALRGGTSPDLRGLMTWSINWDRYYGWEFMNNHEPFLNSLP